jgi:hypothetical protein
MDPFGLFLRLSRFGQPSEVLAPTELLRATAVLHARGLLNAQVIQHNLDWIWPYWVNRQFDPASGSFVPRAFSLTHINLTHRNWTAVGLPHSEHTPLVDPAGLVTPFWDGWSLDAWIIAKDGQTLIPARLEEVSQRLDCEGNLRVITEASCGELSLRSEVEVSLDNGVPVCKVTFSARSPVAADLVVSVRPYNPEGVSLISDIAQLKDKPGWIINRCHTVLLSARPRHYALSNFHQGDVYHRIDGAPVADHIHCPMEMATAAAVFPLVPGETTGLKVKVPLESGADKPRRRPPEAAASAPEPDRLWTECLREAPRLVTGDGRFDYLFEASLRTVLLHSSGEVYAGPFIYKRFWFRDAVFITYALLCCGFHDRARRIINSFFSRQKLSGYFESQEGEWDSNGQVLWLIEQYCRISGREPEARWLKMVNRGARWIIRKRLMDDSEKPHAGLMPPGFSAEHFGPNNFYYWDDFWSVAGLDATAYLNGLSGDTVNREIAERESVSLMQSITRSLALAEKRLGRPAMPSAPTRRLDSAAVGNLIVSYPLDLWKSTDLRVRDTARYLMDHCLVHDGFFHDMSHSGINPYLTLHIAQVLLKAGDPEYLRLINGIAELASPTGQWPEAVHPNTKGGCMGDGQHVWAAAEWLMMIRNCFVMEDSPGKKLILCSGVPESWLSEGRTVSFGPAWTSRGKIKIDARLERGALEVSWQGDWHGEAPAIEVHSPDGRTVQAAAGESRVSVDLGRGDHKAGGQ